MNNDDSVLSIFGDIGGIPVRINPLMPENEVWMVVESKKISIHVHEGPHAGETVEEWLVRPQIHRIINLGSMTEIPKYPAGTFKIKIDKPDK